LFKTVYIKLYVETHQNTVFILLFCWRFGNDWKQQQLPKHQQKQYMYF